MASRNGPGHAYKYKTLERQDEGTTSKSSTRREQPEQRYTAMRRQREELESLRRFQDDSVATQIATGLMSGEDVRRMQEYNDSLAAMLVADGLEESDESMSEGSHSDVEMMREPYNLRPRRQQIAHSSGIAGSGARPGSITGASTGRSSQAYSGLSPQSHIRESRGYHPRTSWPLERTTLGMQSAQETAVRPYQQRPSSSSSMPKDLLASIPSRLDAVANRLGRAQLPNNANNSEIFRSVRDMDLQEVAPVSQDLSSQLRAEFDNPNVCMTAGVSPLLPQAASSTSPTRSLQLWNPALKSPQNQGEKIRARLATAASPTNDQAIPDLGTDEDQLPEDADLQTISCKRRRARGSSHGKVDVGFPGTSSPDQHDTGSRVHRRRGSVGVGPSHLDLAPMMVQSAVQEHLQISSTDVGANPLRSIFCGGRSTQCSAHTNDPLYTHDNTSTQQQSAGALSPSIMGGNVVSKIDIRSIFRPGLPIGLDTHVFTSELLPRTWRHNQAKRDELLHVFRTRAAYVPMCVVELGYGFRGYLQMQLHVVDQTVTVSTGQPDAPASNPSNASSTALMQMPTEMYGNIADHLPRGDRMALRLVNKMFEVQVSKNLFQTVVVPFRPEIYGMMRHAGDDIENERKHPTGKKSAIGNDENTGEKNGDSKGKGKASELEDLALTDKTKNAKGKGKAIDDEGLYNPNSNTENGKFIAHDETEEVKYVHDDMRAFQRWGPEVTNFAMTFDVDEGTLSNPPPKDRYSEHKAFWGTYEWPHYYYNRFAYCKGLEKKADEFKGMSRAFSCLHEAEHLALSLDSGLGWLCGPDISDRAQLLKEKPRVFKTGNNVPENEAVERLRIWEGISQCCWNDLACQRPRIQDPPSTLEVIVPMTRNQGNTVYRPEQAYVSHIGGPKPADYIPPVFEGIDISNRTFGVFYGCARAQMVMLNENIDDAMLARIDQNIQSPQPNRARFANVALAPNRLTIWQQEWLLETGWAQAAFLASFSMALTDNTDTFQHVKSLNLAKISSGHLQELHRDDIWHALPQVESLTIFVSADWRNVSKTSTGEVHDVAITPSRGAIQFYTLLRDYVADLSKIKHLTVGYVGGGEHQIGIFGRNKNILPAPLMEYSDLSALTDPNSSTLRLPFVQKLTLENCWMTPRSLTTVGNQSTMHTLRLKSVSLSADPVEPFATTPLNVSRQDGSFYTIARGSPRRGDASVGDFFSTHHTDPDPTGYITGGERVGSWSHVLDQLSPGATADFIRYAHQYAEDVPALHRGVLQRLELTSCGYVRLPDFPPSSFNQARFTQLAARYVDLHFTIREQELEPVMLKRADELLGSVVPAVEGVEREWLVSGWGMVFGWGGREEARENLEDAQPEGGEGRFGGVVGRIVFEEMGG